jgi:Tfp pilus assembly protein PilZ
MKDFLCVIFAIVFNYVIIAIVLFTCYQKVTSKNTPPGKKSYPVARGLQTQPCNRNLACSKTSLFPILDPKPLLSLPRGKCSGAKSRKNRRSFMNDSPLESRSSVKAEVKELLENILVAVPYASEDQQRSLLSTLREWQKGERRKHRRIACSIPVKVGTWRVFAEHIRNISEGGVFIKTTAVFSPGEHLELIFSLPNQNGPVRITGHVVWNSPEGVGLEFTQPLSRELVRVIESL